MTGSVDGFKAALGGDIVVPGVDRAGGLSATEVLATRGWFDGRRRLTSSGGRPTNPDWTIKRQVPFSEGTWDKLKRIAAEWSMPGTQFGPGQVAAFVLEAAVYSSSHDDVVTARVATTDVRNEGNEDLEARFRNWRQPEIFAGRIAA